MISDRHALRAELAAMSGADDGAPRFAWAPCRISPVGAHTDHQGGLTSGFTLDRGIMLVFRPRADGRVRLRSRDAGHEIGFDLDRVPPPSGDWGDYVRGVARELRDRHGIARGLDGCLAGDLPSGGISTSAALQVAVLLALEEANGLDLPRADAMRLVVEAERSYAGVQVGLLDPAVILFGKPSALVVIDCEEGVPRVHRFARSMPPVEWLLVDSGLPRDLRTSPYNRRVEECRAAARVLGAPPDRERLRAVSPETFRRERRNLDPVSLRRAEHFFAEHKRVKLALECIASGDAASFGRLVSASGESLTNLFECGTPETRDLLALLRGAPGVLGASYAGGGFGGMLQALAHPGSAAGVEAAAFPAYRSRWPEAGARASIRAVGMGPGAHVVRE